MKYFTPEIWAGWQGDAAACARAMWQWNRNYAKYRANLRKLVPRLGPRYGAFFTKHSLHDGRLLQYAINDQPASNFRKREEDAKTSLRIMVLSCTQPSWVYELLYTDVSNLTVHTRNNLFALPNSRFGDWGYDELLSAGKQAFKHNVLFQTGTELSITFGTFKFKRCRATVRLLRHLTALTIL